MSFWMHSNPTSLLRAVFVRRRGVPYEIETVSGRELYVNQLADRSIRRLYMFHTFARLISKINIYWPLTAGNLARCQGGRIGHCLEFVCTFVCVPARLSVREDERM